jgi:prepilin-type N-terminal cleavage/methylation domain-containing protein/prepilin-type processing-associated H-X9-DG protein
MQLSDDSICCVVPFNRREINSMRPGWFPVVARSSGRGFTLVELLVVIGVLSIMTCLLLPALNQARRKGWQTQCMSNLKRVGIALNQYAADHGDSLPGPVSRRVCASYDAGSTSELVCDLAEYLGLPAPTSRPVVAKVMVCPAYERLAPDVTSMEGRKCYSLNPNVSTNSTVAVPPFGRLEGPVSPPLKWSRLRDFGAPGDLFVMEDMDKGNVDPTVSGWSDLPYAPVHGSERNRLYFDGHARAVRW